MIRFRFLSVDFYVSFWVIALISFGVTSSVAGQEIILICLFCSMIHESGHLLMIFRFKGKPDKIILHPSEIRICCDLSDLSVIQDAVITSAGVVANIILSLCTYGLSFWVCNELLVTVCYTSLAIGFINALPIETFDGGQLLRIVLLRFFSEKTASVITFIFSLIFVVPIVYIGIGALFATKYNFSLLFIALYIIIIYIERNCGDSIVEKGS